MELNDVKLIDIGSGLRPTPGYTSVDLFRDAEIKGDIRDLPFKDNQIVEAVCNHVLEHLPYKDVDGALKEVLRVLQHGGMFKIEVPDLEWILSDWVMADESQRWGHRFERIFGQETHEGDFHKCGFTKEKLEEKLKNAGFVDVEVVEKMVEFHDGVLQATAVKP